MNTLALTDTAVVPATDPAEIPPFLRRAPSTSTAVVAVLPPAKAELVMPNRVAEAVTEIRRLHHDRLAVVAAEIQRLHGEVQASLRTALPKAIQIGVLLVEVKKMTPHGGWLPWVATHCNLGEQSAQRYMRLARHRAEVETNTSLTLHLTIDAALKRIARPRGRSTKPRPARKTEPRVDDVADEFTVAGADMAALAMKHAQRIAVGRTADELRAYRDAFEESIWTLIAARQP